MAINMMCENSECKHYWEDNCMRNMNEERINIDASGTCTTFEEGVNELYKQENGLKVYFDGDSVWYASPYELEETALILAKDMHLDLTELLDTLEECDLDKDCMWYPTNKQEDIETLGDYDEHCNGGIGDLRKGQENNVEKLMSFREVIKIQGTSKKPYIIAASDY